MPHQSHRVQINRGHPCWVSGKRFSSMGVIAWRIISTNCCAVLVMTYRELGWRRTMDWKTRKILVSRYPVYLHTKSTTLRCVLHMLTHRSLCACVWSFFFLSILHSADGFTSMAFGGISSFHLWTTSAAAIRQIIRKIRERKRPKKEKQKLWTYAVISQSCRIADPVFS